MEGEKISSKIYSKLLGVFQLQANEKEIKWYRGRIAKIAQSESYTDFYISFCSVSKFIGKEKLNFSAGFMDELQRLKKGFTIYSWRKNQLVRILLLLFMAEKFEHEFIGILSKLYETADVDEQVSLYAGFPAYPNPRKIIDRASEGIRTNITDVFDAISLGNPFPYDHLDESAWNQMVLKAIFMERPLYKIYGLDNRCNLMLAKIACDYAHERWAAGREVTPEIWRLVVDFVDNDIIIDINKLLENKNPIHQMAGCLVLNQSDHPNSDVLLNKYSSLKDSLVKDRIDWKLLGQEWQKVTAKN